MRRILLFLLVLVAFRLSADDSILRGLDLDSRGFPVITDNDLAFSMSMDGEKPLIERAREGSAEHQTLLAYKYYNGVYTEIDFPRAYFWFRKAADQGNAEALRMMGHFYYDGKAVPIDYTEARRWFLRAADRGDYSALTILGYMYQEGLGVQGNLRTTLDYYSRAIELTPESELACSEATFQTAIIYQKVEKDYVRALEMFNSLHLIDQADVEVGLMYYRGEGVAVDYYVAYQKFIGAISAYNYFRSADKPLVFDSRSNQQALFMAGLMNYYGQGVPMNLQQAAVLVREAMNRGVDNARVFMDDKNLYRYLPD